MIDSPARRFAIAFDPPFQVASLLVGVTPARAWVELRDGTLTARFGPWVLTTPLDNVVAAEVTGPYAWPKVIGTPHLSLTDNGLTFAGNARRGVCIRFHEPVPGIGPLGHIRHPGLTATVADPDGLVEALREHIAGIGGSPEPAPVLRLPVPAGGTAPAPAPPGAPGAERQAELRHRLARRTVNQLRGLGRAHGIDLRGRTRKADIVLVLARELPPDALVE